MTKSMTAFSSSSDEQDWGVLSWEIRSVNHRYLDAGFKLPDELRSIEGKLRSILTQKIKRGKLECNLRFKPSVEVQPEIKINESAAKAVLKACQFVNKQLHQPSEINGIEVLKWPGVVEEPESDFGSVMDAAIVLFETAVKDLLESRKSEGQRLQLMIEERCHAMKEIVDAERQRRPQIMQQMREKMLSKIKELAVDYDKDRFEQELVYIAQKMDVDEELDRMDSHFKEIDTILDSSEPVGRRLDFIMQEFNREANTLGSKSTDIKTTQASVELKVLIEQMREQVQNIE